MRYPFSLALDDSRSVLAVKGSLRRFAPWTAAGRSEGMAVYEEKGGLVFRFYPFKGWFWFFDPVIYSQSSSLLLLVLITCSYYLYVCSVWSKNQGYVCSVWSKSRAFCVFGLVVENSPESPLPVDKSHGGCRAERRKKPQERLFRAGRP